MAILMKLKSAKENVTRYGWHYFVYKFSLISWIYSNKKRKYCEKIVEDELAKYQTAVKDIVSKFLVKRDARSKKVSFFNIYL